MRRLIDTFLASKSHVTTPDTPGDQNIETAAFVTRPRGPRRRRTRLRPRAEALEARLALSTFTVNTVTDTVAVNLSTGKDAAGRISLRSAIQAANARPGADTIILPNKTYTLTRAGANEDNALTGDLDIKGDLKIQGLGMPVVDANALDRVFHTLSGKVTITNVAIKNGVAPQGGGLYNVGANVTLSHVLVANNKAVGTNGANGADGGPSGTPSGLDGAAGGFALGAYGGGIYNQAGSLAITNNSAITGNLAIGGNGGNGGNGSNGQGTTGTSTLPGSDASGGAGGSGGLGGDAVGGGIFNAPGAKLALSGVTFSGNQANGGTGGAGGAGGLAVGGDGGNQTNSSLSGRVGGEGRGGAGGTGGDGGQAIGGGLYNQGVVTLSGSPVIFNGNQANGGAGGRGGNSGSAIGGTGGVGLVTGGRGGDGRTGLGGFGGNGGQARGGAIASLGGSITGNASLQVTNNQANGGTGGASGDGASVTGGRGPDDYEGGRGAYFAFGGAVNHGGLGGDALGGGLFNGSFATFALSAPSNNTSNPAGSKFVGNQANGGTGGAGGHGGNAYGGVGGNAFGAGIRGTGGGAYAGVGGGGWYGGRASGGAIYNAGNASFVGITVNISSNTARGGSGGAGGAGGESYGGNGGVGGSQATGNGDAGNSFGGDGGSGGNGGDAQGGGIYNALSGVLTLSPRRGARKNSPQSRAVDTISANSAVGGLGGIPGPGGLAHFGRPGTAAGSFGMVKNGTNGFVPVAGKGTGGGLFLDPAGTAAISNTTITNNQASTADNDVHGTFTPAP